MENITYPNLHVPQTKCLQICRCSQFLHLSGTSGHTQRCVFAITKVLGEQTEPLPPLFAVFCKDKLHFCKDEPYKILVRNKMPFSNGLTELTEFQASLFFQKLLSCLTRSDRRHLFSVVQQEQVGSEIYSYSSA